MCTVGAMVAVWLAIAGQLVQLVKLVQLQTVQLLVQSECDRQAGVGGLCTMAPPVGAKVAAGVTGAVGEVGAVLGAVRV